MPKHQPKLSPQILEEAATWFINLNEGEVERPAREEFNTWLRRSPEHVQAYLQVAAFWEDAAAFKGLDVDLQTLVDKAAKEQNVYPLDAGARFERSRDTHDPTAGQNNIAHATWRDGLAPAAAIGRGSSFQRVRRYGLPLAAALLLTVGLAATTWYFSFRFPTYVTSVGEQRSITLDDGSTIELNARSRVKVAYTAQQRTIELLEGQALFSVSKDATRPFIVRSGSTSVLAVGTQFDVYRKRSVTVVTVVEGKVAVASVDRSSGVPAASASAVQGGSAGAPVEVVPVLVSAGQQVIVGGAMQPKATDTAVATAWTEKKLIFQDTPLRDVVDEFNRYNHRALVIKDPELYDFHVSGVFPSTNSARMVEFLRQRFGIAIRDDGDTIEISRAADSATH